MCLAKTALPLGKDGIAMSKLSFSEPRYKKALKGKGFYVALSISLVAVGVAGFVAISNTYSKLLPDDGLNSTPIVVEWGDNSANPAGNTVSGVPDTSGDQSEPVESAEEVNTTPEKKLFMMPVSGECYNPFSGDKLVFSQTMEDWRVHHGADLAASLGANVRAAADGVVKDVRWDDLWGTVVEIDHGDGLVAMYCGLGSNVSVKKGDEIEIGTVIGVITEVPVEVAEQPHLHLVMMQDGKVIDPMSILKKDN